MSGDRARPAESLPELPSRFRLLDLIQAHLENQGELGLLSVSVLRRLMRTGAGSWTTYESMLGEVSEFLAGFRGQGLRCTDLLLHPVVTGNKFAVIIGPPRENRPLERADLELVGQRLSRGLEARFEGSVPEVAGRYGVYVGAALVRRESAVDSRGTVDRALEESFADGLDRRRGEVLQRTEQLQRVLRTRSVTTVYQPLVDIVDHRVIGYEALTRLPDEGHGNPGQLFRTASENGTLWAIERLCRRSALENVPGLEADQKLFINVEPASFRDPQLCRRSFDGLLEAAGLRPEQLVLEMTGHAVVREIDAVRQAIDMVRGLGLRVAFDGVSPEHPGLEAVREIRPDYVKIDMSLVRNLHRDPGKRERVERIRRLADPAGITIVAEGVETQEELEALAAAGVRCAQGFLFARPAASPESPDWEELRTPVAVGSGESHN